MAPLQSVGSAEVSFAVQVSEEHGQSAVVAVEVVVAAEGEAAVAEVLEVELLAVQEVVEMS